MEDYLGLGKKPDYTGIIGKMPNYIKLLGNNSSEEGRKPFSSLAKSKTVQRQRNLCAECFRPFTELRLPQYHHKNGDKTDNSERNCQALHSDCHDRISRDNNSQRER
jgi:hypothetical protein